MWVPEAILELIGPAAAWCQKFCRENRSPTWEKSSEQIHYQYTTKFADNTAARNLDSPMHVGSVKDYKEAHMKICRHTLYIIGVGSAISWHILMKNMRPHLYKLVDIRQWDFLPDNSFKALNAEDKAHLSSCQRIRITRRVAGGQQQALWVSTRPFLRNEEAQVSLY